MRRVLRDFSNKTRDADMAVVYYAGHGIEVDGINYLVPVDAVLEQDGDAFDETVQLDRVPAGDRAGEEAAARHSRCLPRQSVCANDEANRGEPRRSAAASPASNPASPTR